MNNNNNNNNIVKPTPVDLNKVERTNNDTFLNRERDNIVSATMQANQAIDKEAAKEINNRYKIKKQGSYKNLFIVFICFFIAISLGLGALVLMKEAEYNYKQENSTTTTVPTTLSPLQREINYLTNTSRTRKYENSYYMLLLSPYGYDLVNNNNFYMLIKNNTSMKPSTTTPEYGTYTINEDNSVTLKGTNIKGIKTLTLTESGLVLEKNALKKSDSEMKYYKYDGNNEKGVLIINGKSYNEAALYVTTNTSKTTYNVFNYEENSEYIKLSDGTTFHKDDFNLKLKDKIYEYCK